jgi:hypothetical protein
MRAGFLFPHHLGVHGERRAADLGRLRAGDAFGKDSSGPLLIPPYKTLATVSRFYNLFGRMTVTRLTWCTSGCNCFFFSSS